MLKAHIEDRSGAWPLVNCVYRRAELLSDVMRMTGVNPLAAARLDDGRAIVEARRACLTCPHVGACRDWMECSNGLPMPPDFCPNKAFFERCKRD